MSDPTALVAERVLMIAETSFLDQAATNDLKSAAALIAQQAASIAARDDELIGERWHADEAARQRDVAKATIEAVTKERDEALRLRDYWLYQHDQLVEEVHQLQDAVEGHVAGQALATALARYGFPMSAEAWRNTGDDAPVNSQASVEARALHRAAVAFREVSGADNVG